jgi:hypothetical protein
MDADRYTAGRYSTLERLWHRVIEPALGDILSDLSGIDLLPVGWLAGIPWHAVGPNPRGRDCLYQRASVSLLPGLWWLASDYVNTAKTEARVFVRGDYSG